VQIISPVIIGDIESHRGNSGEWGMGIAIRSSKNIVISSPHISNCWGDGIYVGENQKNGPSRDIQISNAVIDNNRRNGISITSVNTLQITNSIISNSNGTLPMTGIDIEPGNENEEIKNVVISNVTTFNNHKAGIVVNLSKLSANGKKDHNVSINIDSHKDEFSG